MAIIRYAIFSKGQSVSCGTSILWLLLRAHLSTTYGEMAARAAPIFLSWLRPLLAMAYRHLAARHTLIFRPLLEPLPALGIAQAL